MNLTPWVSLALMSCACRSSPPTEAIRGRCVQRPTTGAQGATALHEPVAERRATVKEALEVGRAGRALGNGRIVLVHRKRQPTRGAGQPDGIGDGRQREGRSARLRAPSRATAWSADLANHVSCAWTGVAVARRGQHRRKQRLDGSPIRHPGHFDHANPPMMNAR